MNTRQIEALLAAVTGGSTPGRVERLRRILDKLTDEEKKRFRLEECSDERTGSRYGQAQCRKGACEKIGSGGRNRGSKYAYQVWAVWS